jgi:hypothetical protein
VRPRRQVRFSEGVSVGARAMNRDIGLSLPPMVVRRKD